jgi:ribosomal protein S18 acetylase RimI-like enzyme
MILVREVAEDDWELMRDVRLAALSEAPYAFGSTHAREAAFTEEKWRGRFSERSVTFFAHEEPDDGEPSDRGPATTGPATTGPANTGPATTGPANTGLATTGAANERPAGLAGVYVEDGTADLVSMWVRPSARGRGVGEALVEAAAAWAKAHHFGALYLWVTESNAPARRLYERCGFTPTGESQPLPSDPALPEIRMSRAL